MDHHDWVACLRTLAGTRDVDSLEANAHAVEVRRAEWGPPAGCSRWTEADEWRIMLASPPGEAWAIEGLLAPGGRPLAWSARLRQWRSDSGWSDTPGSRRNAVWAGRLLETAWLHEARHRLPPREVPGDTDSTTDQAPASDPTGPTIELRRPEWTVATGNGTAQRILATQARIRNRGRGRTWRVAVDGSLWPPADGGTPPTESRPPRQPRGPRPDGQ